MKSKILWSPSKDLIQSTNLYRFIHFISNDVNFAIDTNLDLESQYKELYNWSINSSEEFWLSFLKFSNIKYDGKVLSVCDDIYKMPGANWFEGSKLNFCENLLRYKDDHIAIRYYREDGNKVFLSYECSKC